jgi:MarR family transcriptional regulator, organic hydroperoxide resistance regulator
MIENSKTLLVHEFLGSSQIFVSALQDIIDKDILSQVLKNKFTVTQLKLLRLVNSGDQHTISEVAAFLGVSNAAASKTADRLVRQLLLRRCEGESDRRTMLLTLTERSRRLLAAYDEARENKLHELFEDLSAADLKRSIEILDRLSARIVQQTAYPDDICLQCGIYTREKCLLKNMLQRPCIYQRYRGAKSQQDNAK